MVWKELEDQALEVAVEDGGNSSFTYTPDEVVCYGSVAGTTVTAQDVSFKVGRGRRTLAILDKVTIDLAPGSMTALLGPSGSGKTTLLDIIAGRKTSGRVEGTVTYNGVKPSTTYLRQNVGYVEQVDSLLASFTVEEMLHYTVDMKIQRTMTRDQKLALIDQMVQNLMLEDCRHTRIGDALRRGISGGQCKRVNIAIALVCKPNVLLLDEPTSGLDSFTAYEVMSCVRQLQQKEAMTVCATIHSPSPSVFELFDRLMVLVDGRTVYLGPRATARDYFMHLGRAADLDDGASDAEWITHLVMAAKRNNTSKDLAAAYSASVLNAINSTKVMNLSSSITASSKDDVASAAVPTSQPRPVNHSEGWGFLQLLKHRGRKDFTDPDFVIPRIMDKLVFTLVIMTVYWGLGDSVTEQNIINQFSLLFMWCILPAFAATGYIPSIVLERSLFYRERSDGLYRSVTYYFFKLFEEFILVLLLSPGLAAMVFYGTQLRGSFVLFWLIYLVTVCAGVSLGYMIAALSPNMHVANAVLPIYVTVLLFFAGLLIVHSSIPDGWRWFSYIDFLRYAWGSLMMNQFPDDINLGYVTVLQQFDLDGYEKWAWLGFEAMFPIVFVVIGLLALTFIRHQRR